MKKNNRTDSDEIEDTIMVCALALAAVAAVAFLVWTEVTQ